MKRVLLAWPLQLAVTLSVLAIAVGGCKGNGGSKDAGDYCNDVCDLFLACDDCRITDPNNLVPNDRDNCITFSNYQAIQISNFDGLNSFCVRLCSEIEGEVGAVKPDCSDALSDFWQCTAETTTCDLIEGIPLIADPGGVFLPTGISSCAAEIAEALEVCMDDDLS